MNVSRLLTAALAVTALSATSVMAQQPQRLAGEIQRVDGNLVFSKARDGSPVTIKLADKLVVTAVLKATVADIELGAYIGSGAVPQADGSQKAVEVHIFAESQRGTGEGHRPWNGAPDGTMTNGEVGSAVSGVEGPVITVKYKGGEKKLVVGPSTPIVKYIVSDKSELKQGSSINITNAVKKTDGTFEAARIQVGRDGLVL